MHNDPAADLRAALRRAIEADPGTPYCAAYTAGAAHPAWGAFTTTDRARLIQAALADVADAAEQEKCMLIQRECNLGWLIALALLNGIVIGGALVLVFVR